MNSLTSKHSIVYQQNGLTKAPVVGFGTWQTPDGDVAVSLR